MGPIRLNGKLYTRNSVAVRLQGIDLITGIDTIDWDDERATELIPGMNQGGPPIGKGEGDYSCNASLGIYGDEAELFNAKLALIDPLAAGNLARVNFQLVIQFKEDVRIRTVTLVSCNAKAIGSGVAQGAAAIVEKYTLQPQLIMRGPFALANLIPTV